MKNDFIPVVFKKIAKLFEKTPIRNPIRKPIVIIPSRKTRPVRVCAVVLVDGGCVLDGGPGCGFSDQGCVCDVVFGLSCADQSCPSQGTAFRGGVTRENAENEMDNEVIEYSKNNSNDSTSNKSTTDTEMLENSSNQFVVLKSGNQDFKQSLIFLDGIVDFHFGIAIYGDGKLQKESESVKIDYDESKIDLTAILKIYFLHTNDLGIFYVDDIQKQKLLRSVSELIDAPFIPIFQIFSFE